MRFEWTVLPAFLALVLTLPLEADTVWLTDGARVEGDVMDLGGNSIALRRGRNRRTILKKNIAKITFSLHRDDPDALEEDLVLCHDGHDIAGKATTSEDGQSVDVQLSGGSSVNIPLSNVMKIVKRGEHFSTSGDFVYYTSELEDGIKKAIAELSSTDAEIAATAERFLKESGIFAVNLIQAAEDRGEIRGEQARKAISRVVYLHELKKRVSSHVETMESRTYEILTMGSVDEKEQLLLEMFSRHGDESMALASFLLLAEEEDPALRASIVSIMGSLQRNTDLVQLYRISRGQVQLSLALALGQNRILIGVPTLIEALEMENPAVRKLAIDNLKKFVGKDFDYHAEDLPHARRRAVKRWKRWWRDNREDIKAQTTGMIAGKKVETAQRSRARELWQKAGEMALKGRDLEAEALLREAVRSDPLFVNAHIHLGALLYTRRNKFVEAQSVFEDLLNRKIPGMDAQDYRWVYYHLGRLYQLQDDYTKALREFERCVAADPSFYRARIALGDLCFRRSIDDSSLEPAQRRRWITKSREHYQDALERISAYQKDLVIIVKEDLSLKEAPPFDMREHNRTVLSARRHLRISRARVLLGIGRLDSMVGQKSDAIYTIIDGVNTLRDDSSEEGKEIAVDLRNYLALLYEEIGQYSDALREYRTVLDELDKTNAEALEGIKRLDARVSGTRVGRSSRDGKSPRRLDPP